MTTAILRPNLTVASTGTQIVGGAGTVHATLADGADADLTGQDGTYIWATGSSPSTALVELTTVAMPAGSVTKSVTVRVRARASGSTPGRMVADVRKADHTVLATNDIATYTSSFSTKSGATAAVTLTQAEVDGLRVYGHTNKSQSNPYNTRWAAVAVDLVYVTIPTVTVTAPTGTIGTDTVTATWSFDQADVDGAAQSGWEMAVFTAAQYGIGGFDPATSPASLRTSGANPNTTGAVSGMPDGTNHRVYVRAYELINGQPHWSAWAYSQFTISTTRAQVLSLTATPVPGFNRVDLTVGRDTGQDAWVSVDVERQVDGVWTRLVGSPFTATGNTATVSDRLAPSDVATKWRARAANAGGTWGAWVETGAALTWTALGVFIRDLLDPATEWQAAGWELDGFPDEGKEVPQSVFDVIGATVPVVVSDVPTWRGGSFRVECSTLADSDELVALCDGRVLVLSQPLALGPMMQVVASKWLRERDETQLVGERRFVTVDYQRVG